MDSKDGRLTLPFHLAAKYARLLFILSVVDCRALAAVGRGVRLRVCGLAFGPSSGI
jgi:hypothetical protein